MKKGFAATPILFAAIFLIVGWLMIHYMNMDNFVASGIKKEGEIRKVQATALKDILVNRTNSFLAGVYCAQKEQNFPDLESCIETTTGNSVKIKNINGGHQFEISYSIPVKEKFESSGVEKTFSVSETIDYPFQKLVNATNGFSVSSNISCNLIIQSLQNHPAGIYWSVYGPYCNSCSFYCDYPCQKHGCCRGHYECKYTICVNSNFVIGNNLSSLYVHQITPRICSNGVCESHSQWC